MDFWIVCDELMGGLLGFVDFVGLDQIDRRRLIRRRVCRSTQQTVILGSLAAMTSAAASRTNRSPSWSSSRQQRLYFLPLPQWQGSFRPIFVAMMGILHKMERRG